MQDDANLAISPPKRTPWNKGKLIGAKPPLRQKHVWTIRTMLQVERSTRDLTMFNLAIDSKLRGCDVVAIRVVDVAPNGYAIDRATVRQRKTGRPVRFELTEQTRQAVDDYLKISHKKPGEFLFSAPKSEQSMTPRQYARLVSDWLIGIGLDPHLYGHTLTAANEGNADLPAHRESARRPASAWSHQDREHCAVSRHRCGRRSRHSGAGRCLKYRAEQKCSALHQHPRCSLFRPLSGVKRTCHFAAQMSAFDPKRTLTADAKFRGCWPLVQFEAVRV